MAIQTNLATITPRPDVVVDLAEVPRVIERSGFTPGEMTILAAGTFEREGEEVRFRIAGWPTTFVVESAPQDLEGREAVRMKVEYSARPPRLIVAPPSSDDAGGT